MRLKAIFIVLLFFSSLFVAAVQGTTPESIEVDGDFSDWDSDTLMGTDGNGIDLRLTWNESMLFVGWDGTDWKSTDEGADLFVYLNTSEGALFSPVIGVLHTHFRSPQITDLCWKMTPITSTSHTMEVRGLTNRPASTSMRVGRTTR